MIADVQASTPAWTDPAAGQGLLWRRVLRQSSRGADQLACLRGPDSQDASDLLGIPSLLPQQAYPLEAFIRRHRPDRKTGTTPPWRSSAGTARQVIGRVPLLQRQNGGVPGDMLVGRRLAVGALRAAVDTAAGGAGGVVLLAGEAGMGKTALAAEAVAYAKARGAAAVWGTCWEGGGAPGFWPWIQVVRALAADGDGAGEALLAELAGQAELIRLTGLTADEIGQLIEKVYGERPQAALIQAVHDRTAGNPFFAQQIARLLAAQ